jgi:hypothetical protein
MNSTMSYNRVAVDISRSTDLRSVFVSRCNTDADMINDFITSTWPEKDNRPDQSMFVGVSPGSVSIDNMCLRAWLFTVVCDYPFEMNHR